MFQRGWFHVDVANGELRRRVVGIVQQYGPARVQSLSDDGLGELASDGRFAGLVLELTGGWHARVQRLRLHVPCLPVLVLLDAGSRVHVNRLQSWGMTTALTPFDDDTLVSFVQRALTHSFVPSERITRLISRLVESHSLTAREVQLLSYCLADEPRALVRRRLGITENTLKTQVRGLLRKCGERNLDALAKNLLRSALLPAQGEPRTSVDEVTQPALRLPFADQYSSQFCSTVR